MPQWNNDEINRVLVHSYQAQQQCAAVMSAVLKTHFSFKWKWWKFRCMEGKNLSEISVAYTCGRSLSCIWNAVVCSVYYVLENAVAGFCRVATCQIELEWKINPSAMQHPSKEQLLVVKPQISSSAPHHPYPQFIGIITKLVSHWPAQAVPRLSPEFSWDWLQFSLDP